MAKKRTKAYQQEYTWVYYGIHSDTFEIKTVWQSRDGVLHGEYGSHSIYPGSSARSEVALVFHLFEVRGMHVNGDDTRIIEELREIAARSKAEKQSPPTP